MKKSISILAACLILTGTAAVTAQEDVVDRLSVPFSDPGKPGFIEVGLVNGSIAVTGYDGGEVVIEAKTRTRRISQDEERVKGMIRIPVTTTGLEVEEKDNQMEIGVESWKRTIDLTLRVPFNTSLSLHTVNNGDIKIENVRGELDVNNTNGRVTLTNVSGSVVAPALNKDLIVPFDQIFPEKPMSFSTLNGDVNVTFPADLKADVYIDSDNGDVYSDFEVELSRLNREVVEENKRDRDGKYRVRIDRRIYGKINGGGQEITFKSFQGDIYIRRAK